jgi:hypothetical protein
MNSAASGVAGFLGLGGSDDRGAENSTAEGTFRYPDKFSHRTCTNLMGPPDCSWRDPDPRTPCQLRPCHQHQNNDIHFMYKKCFFPVPILLILATATLGMIGLVVVAMCSAMTITFFACLADSMGYRLVIERSFRCLKIWGLSPQNPPMPTLLIKFYLLGCTLFCTTDIKHY